MPRTIVYASDVPPPPAPPPEELLQPKSAGTPRKRKPVVEATAAGPAPDTYSDKFLKYIPAETIAFYAPLAALTDLGIPGRWVLFGLGLVVTVVYLAVRAKREKLAPPAVYYALGALAFGAWAIGTSDFLTAVAGVPDLWSKIGFGAAVFLIPGLDEALLS